MTSRAVAIPVPAVATPRNRPRFLRQDPELLLGAGRPGRREARRMLNLAWPMTMSALVNMGISVTDVLMIAMIGPVALAASAVASDFYSIIVYLAGGVIAAIAPFIARARGAGNFDDVRRATRQGFWAAALVAGPGALLIWNADIVLLAIGIEASLVETGMPYGRMMALTFIPMVGLQVWRYFLSAHDRPRVMLVVMLFALPVNALFNWILMFGKWGFPELGLAGAGLSSLGTTTLVFAALTVYVLQDRALRRYHLFRRFWKHDLQCLRTIFRIGVPIGLASLGETGVFLFSTVLMGVFGAEVVAAHAITLRVAGIFYAPALGLGQAVTVRVAYALGQRKRARISGAVWTALALSAVLGATLFGVLLLAGDYVPGLFIAAHEPMAARVTALALPMLFCLAVLQLTENAGVIGTSVLRGIQDTARPMVLQLTGRWVIGFSASLLLAFPVGLGGLGIWMGLAIGSAATAAGMWARVRHMPIPSQTQ